MEKIKSGLIIFVGYVVLGAAVMLGIRGIEYLIHKPPILICLASDVGRVERCEQLEEK